MRFIKIGTVEAPPERDEREVRWRPCGAPLKGREGEIRPQVFPAAAKPHDEENISVEPTWLI